MSVFNWVALLRLIELPISHRFRLLSVFLIRPSFVTRVLPLRAALKMLSGCLMVCGLQMLNE